MSVGSLRGYLKRTVLGAVGSIVLLMQGALVSAATYTNGINSGVWQSDSSLFECRLTQSVPFYGDAIFRTRAGESLNFYLDAKTRRFQSGKASIKAKSPAWKSKLADVSLGVVPVKKSHTPLWLKTGKSEAMLSSLNEGQALEIHSKAWYLKSGRDGTALNITPIGFRKEYQKYLNCLSMLLPANFDQLERTALYYPVGPTDELSAASKKKLGQILQLVKHDKGIRHFYIDGHASAPGDRGDNLDLSKTRVDLVVDFLKLRGVPEDWMTVRWHGERYPARSNNSFGGRAKNRRVTVRLERVKELEVLPLASRNRQ